MRNLSHFRQKRSRARAAAGAALLDQFVPGWWRKIKIRKLDIADACNCVTGQLFGDYTKGLERLNIGRLEAADYGFEYMEGEGGYWTLTDQWREEVRRRRYGERVGRQ